MPFPQCTIFLYVGILELCLNTDMRLRAHVCACGGEACMRASVRFIGFNCCFNSLEFGHITRSGCYTPPSLSFLGLFNTYVTSVNQCFADWCKLSLLDTGNRAMSLCGEKNAKQKTKKKYATIQCFSTP